MAITTSKRHDQAGVRTTVSSNPQDAHILRTGPGSPGSPGSRIMPLCASAWKTPGSGRPSFESDTLEREGVAGHWDNVEREARAGAVRGAGEVVPDTVGACVSLGALARSFLCSSLDRRFSPAAIWVTRTPSRCASTTIFRRQSSWRYVTATTARNARSRTTAITSRRAGPTRRTSPPICELNGRSRYRSEASPLHRPLLEALPRRDTGCPHLGCAAMGSAMCEVDSITLRTALTASPGCDLGGGAAASWTVGSLSAGPTVCRRSRARGRRERACPASKPILALVLSCEPELQRLVLARPASARSGVRRERRAARARGRSPVA